MTSICGTSPLVAFLNCNDPYHDWAVTLLKQVQPPMLACEPEAAYFLRQDGVPVALRLDFDMSAHWPRLRTLMARYQQMDLTHAAVVVMTELHTRCQVLTVDRKDFSV